MKQHHHTPPSVAASGGTPQVLHLPLAAGQGRLVWLDAGCELRSLSGTALLQSTAPGHLGAAPPACLPPHAAWRSPQGMWVGVQAQGSSPAALTLTMPAGADLTQPAESPGAHEKSRPGHGALQRLWQALRRLFVRRAQPAG